ncbi:Gag-Pol polyprotein [Plakobranchus ocellatus]|uniref:Gag-Pol polyprotein n=1 Tax=Plakobranchus ocellatus TaxID=259542 RepID=A0AAV3ZAL0_9GAST|nr:Gag-Pol polyprotein [Plakobranchus ocellatus]
MPTPILITATSHDRTAAMKKIPVAQNDIPKTANNYTIWAVQISENTIKIKERGSSFPATREQHSLKARLLICLYRPILVANGTPSNHEAALRSVFSPLTLNSLVIKRQKCIFGQTSMTFLRHKISSAGTKAVPESLGCNRLSATKGKKSLYTFWEW